MSTDIRERLYNLLPAIYRIRDAERGEPLRALMAVIESQLQEVEANVDELYRSWFIETCAEWLVPYIGDMLGVRLLHTVESAAGHSLRAYVANTLAYRRRKGTAAVLEQLARDVTGWPSRAVEFFQLLATTQNPNHVRLHSQATLDLRDPNPLDLLEGAFQSAAHTADVRRINTDGGRYNIPNVGLFLWRLQPYLMEGVPATRVGAGLYRFSPLGNDMPLFHVPETETEITHLAEETNVPTPIRRLALYQDLEDYRRQHAATPQESRPEDSLYYGPNRSITVVSDGQPVPPIDVISSNLRNWDRPPAGKLAIDVALGRLAFAAGADPATVEVSCAYGFSADIGGGPYERRHTLATPGPDTLQIEVATGAPVATLGAALTAWQNAGRPPCIIQIADNAIYEDDLSMALPPGGSLVIQAAQGKRPTVRLVEPTLLFGPENAALTLNGLLVQGAISIAGDLELSVAHCTLVPGRSLLEDGAPEFPDHDSIVALSASSRAQVTIDSSIVGTLRLPSGARQLTIRDSIIAAPESGGTQRPAIAANDAGDEPGPPTAMERCTVFGPVHVRELELASESIFRDVVRAQRRQVGCVRFSYTPPSSETPRRHRCQPELALASYARELGVNSVEELTQAERDFVHSRLKPRFTSENYGDPGYAQLSLLCVEGIRQGAEDGSEMGAFQRLRQPQREANLRSALDEYLPFGLEAGLIFVT